VSFQKEPITNLDSRVCERLGRLLRKIVSRIDDAMFMQPDKHAHPSLGTGQMSIDENTGRQQRLGTGQMSTGSKDGRRSVNQKTGPNQTPQMTGGRMRARITGYLTCPQEHDAWRQDAVAYLRLFDLSPRAPKSILAGADVIGNRLDVDRIQRMCCLPEEIRSRNADYLTCPQALLRSER
jgi:hypothetical protein